MRGLAAEPRVLLRLLAAVTLASLAGCALGAPSDAGHADKEAAGGAEGPLRWLSRRVGGGGMEGRGEGSGDAGQATAAAAASAAGVGEESVLEQAVRPLTLLRRSLEGVAARCPASKCPELPPCAPPFSSFSACQGPARRGPLRISSNMRVERVFLNALGAIFNHTHMLDRKGCTFFGKLPGLEHRVGTRVVHVRRVIGLYHKWGSNFFHSLIETLPLLLALSPFLHHNPDLPFFMNPGQLKLLPKLGAQLIGVDVKAMNIICPQGDSLVLAEELLQPIFPTCYRPDPRMHFELRRRFYLHPDGFPLFEPNWAVRRPRPLTRRQMRHIPGDWVVVLHQRPHAGGRAFERDQELYTEMVLLFGEARVVVDRGGLDILQVKELYNHARLFVGVHGAGLSNMVFMPTKSFLLEVVPNLYAYECYRLLAKACGIQYFRAYGNGTRNTDLHVNLSDVSYVLRKVAKAMELSASDSSFALPDSV